MNKSRGIQIGGRSEDVFKRIVQTYKEKVIRFMSLFVSNPQDCEELASDVFLSLWANVDKLAEIDDLNNYIFIISKNKALNHLRRNTPKLIDLEPFQADIFHNTESNPESIYINREIAEQLNDAINELPQKTKLAFMMVRENKMKYKDAAQILGVSIKTIEKQVATAVAKLAAKLKR